MGISVFITRLDQIKMMVEGQNSKTDDMVLNRQDVLILFFLGVLGLVILIPAAIQSTDYAYATTDDYNHYLFAISSPEDAEFLFNGWGKPLFTLSLLLFLLIARQSLEGARFLNCGFYLLSVFLTYALARRLALRRKAAFLSGIFMLLAPQNLELAQSILTEPLFTVMLLTTFLVYAEEKYQVAFTLAGFSLLARSEGLFLIAFLLATHYWRFNIRKTMNYGCLALIPPALTSLTTTIFFRQPLLAFFSPNYSTYQIYGHGQPLEYVLGTQEAIGLPTMLLALLGMTIWVFRSNRPNPAVFPFLAFGVFVVVFHDLIWTFGLFGSWGTLRHLAPSTPVFAYFAGYAFQQGWDYLGTQKWDFKYESPLNSISLGIVVLLAGFWANWHTDLTIAPSIEVQVSEEAITWLKTNRPDAIHNSRALFIYNPIILALLDLTYPDVPNQGGALINREMLENELQPGGIVLWDSHHGPLEGKTPLNYFDQQFQTLFMNSEEWYIDSEGNMVEFSIYIFLKLH